MCVCVCVCARKFVFEENEGVDYMDLIHKSVSAIKHRLEEYQEERRAVKSNMSFHVVFQKAAGPSVVSNSPAVLVIE